MDSLKWLEEVMAPTSLIGFMFLSVIYYSSLTLSPFYRRNPFETKYYEVQEKYSDPVSKSKSKGKASK